MNTTALMADQYCGKTGGVLMVTGSPTATQPGWTVEP